MDILNKALSNNIYEVATKTPLEEAKFLSADLQNNILFNYDQLMIHFFLQPIKNSSDCFYLSFDNQPFHKLIISCALNFYKIDNICLKIISKVKQKIHIKYFEQNIMRIDSGLTGLLFLRNYNNNNEICKLITNDNYCPITHDKISIGESYMTCSSCKKNFQQKALSNWLKSYQNNCPHCRVSWQNKIVYINSDN